MYSAVHVHHPQVSTTLAYDVALRMPPAAPTPAAAHSPPQNPPYPSSNHPIQPPPQSHKAKEKDKEKEIVNVNAIPAVAIQGNKMVFGDANSSSIRSYTLLKVVGDGSFGAVWLCDWHSALPPNTPLSPMQCGQGAKPEYAGKRLVAIKKMKKKWEGGWNECKKLKELESLRDIPPHPNIIPLYDCFLLPSSKELHFVFESMEGNLYQLIKSRKGTRPFAGGLISTVFRQVVSGLLHIHNSGYFHRDMKPENLLVTTTGLADYQPTSPLAPPGAPPEKDVMVIVKLADFGLARETKSKPPYTEYVSTRWYRAPEVLLRSTDYSKPVDMWALGTILAELVTLKPLFPGQGEIDQVYKICEILGDPSDEYGQDTRGRYIGGGRWARGMKMASKVGFQFPKHHPMDFHALFEPSVPASLIECIADLLKYDPEARLTAQDCMDHIYLIETAPRFVHPTTLQIPIHSGSPSSSRSSRIGGGFPSISPRDVPPSHSQSPAAVARPPFNFNGASSSRAIHSIHAAAQAPIASSSTHRNGHYAPGANGAAELVDHLREQEQSDRMDVTYTHAQPHSPEVNGVNGHPAHSQRFGMFGSLKKQKWNLFGHAPGDKQHSLPPVEEMQSAPLSRSTPSLKRTQTNSTDSQSLPEMSPTEATNLPPALPLDPKKAKKEQERLAREAEKARRAAAERLQKEQARAVMMKRERIIQRNAGGSDFDWHSARTIAPQGPTPGRGNKGKERMYEQPQPMPNSSSVPIPIPPVPPQSRGPYSDQSVFSLLTKPLVQVNGDDRPTEHRDKRRRDMRSEDDAFSIDSDVQSVSRLSMISFATVDSDPGPLRPPRRRTSAFGINRTTSSNSLRRTSSRGYPSPRSSHSIEPSGGRSSNSMDQSSQSASDYGEPRPYPADRYMGSISPPPMQMLSLSPVQQPQHWSPDGASFPSSDSSPVLLHNRRLGSQHQQHLTLPPLSQFVPTNPSSPFEFSVTSGLGSRSHPPSPNHHPNSAINPIFQVPPIPTPPPPILPNHHPHSLPPFSTLAAVAEVQHPPPTPP